MSYLRLIHRVQPFIVWQAFYNQKYYCMPYWADDAQHRHDVLSRWHFGHDYAVGAARPAGTPHQCHVATECARHANYEPSSSLTLRDDDGPRVAPVRAVLPAAGGSPRHRNAPPVPH